MKTLMNDSTPESLANECAKAAKLKSWHVWQGIINNKAVEVKIYALFLQIFRIDGIDYAGREFTSQKELKAYIIDSINPLPRIAEKLNEHHMRYMAGFYTKHGRAFKARVENDQLEVFVDWEHWAVIDPKVDVVTDHNGRQIYL